MTQGLHSNTVWPMQPGGGIFLICMGVGLVYGALMQGDAITFGLESGFCAGVVGIVVAIMMARGRFGRPTALHRFVVLAAIALELTAFAILARSGFLSGGQTTTKWSVALLIVALHFIVMRWSHGPLMLWLTLTSIIWIGLAYVLGFSLPALIAGDGLLKIVFGIVMAAPLWLTIRARYGLEATIE